MEMRFKTYAPDQMFLLPPSLREWLPEDHLAYFVSDVVDELDLSEIERAYETDRRGQIECNLSYFTRGRNASMSFRP